MRKSESPVRQKLVAHDVPWYRPQELAISHGRSDVRDEWRPLTCQTSRQLSTDLDDQNSDLGASGRHFSQLTERK
jgi:hypothetical protein